MKKKGKVNGFHPELSCWFKQNEYENKDKNHIKFINNTEIETELSDTEQKKL